MSKRFQIVGSLLRPAPLLKYKRQIELREDITFPFYDSFEGYEACETQSTRDVVAKQIQHGVDILTDGEFSKCLWSLDFAWGLKGVQRYIAPHGYTFRDKDLKTKYETRRDVGIRVVGELTGKNHHWLNIYKRLKSIAGDKTVKICVPSGGHIYGENMIAPTMSYECATYPTADKFKAGLIKAYNEFTDEYAAAGGKIIQFDDCVWEIFASDNPTTQFGAISKDDLTALANTLIEINNAIIDHAHGVGLTVWTHNCRGNYASRNMCDGSYAAIADLFLKQQRYDRFFLEWDDDRAGSVEALRVFADNPKVEVVVGLLCSKTNTLYNEERIVKLLNEAAKIIPKERLYLSHQCGFASCDGGNELTEDEQWAKIDQGQKIALAFWGE
jgi:methionine synthase II (cobalamin-independent)